MAGAGELAREVRAGLKLSVISGGAGNSHSVPSQLDEIWFGKPVRQHVREFGAVMAILLLLIAGFMAWKGSSLANIAALVIVAGSLSFLAAVKPAWLHSTWQGWMTLAGGLGVVMTFVILSVSWGLLVLPMAYGLRLVGKRTMDMSFHAASETYWEVRDTKYNDFKLLERQF